jgi:hypothetical protein
MGSGLLRLQLVGLSDGLSSDPLQECNLLIKQVVSFIATVHRH